MNRQTRRSWLIALIGIGVPCLVIQTTDQVSASRRQTRIDQAFQELSLAQVRLDESKTSATKSEGTRDAEQSLRDAITACHQTIRQRKAIPDWLRIPASIGWFLSFWGIVILAFKKQTS
ncbi:hypothetical protein ES703_91759 [subsurface metagenome]